MGCGSSKTFIRSGLIKLIDSANATKVLCEEHDDIMKIGIQGLYNASTAAVNIRKKNQCVDAPCFDLSRGILSEEENSENYFNASFIDDFKCPGKYLVLKAPSEMTSAAFWNLVWDHKSQVIIMLCSLVENGNIQCHHYWSPVEGTTLRFGKIQIKTVNVDLTNASYTITSLIVTHETEGTLSVSNLMYEQWQDHDISPAESDFPDFVVMTKLYGRSASYSHLRSPMVVHCDSGLGRSMAYCALDTSLSRLENTGKVKVFSDVANLPQQC